MGDRRRLLAIAGGCAAIALMLISCGNPNNAATGAVASGVSAPTPATSAVASTGSPVPDVNCGPITAANGQKLQVVAKGSAAGVAGCTEAIDVLTEYFHRGNESQGTAHELTVAGWQCSTIDNGVTTAVITGCEKDGLSIQAVNR